MPFFKLLCDRPINFLKVKIFDSICNNVGMFLNWRKISIMLETREYRFEIIILDLIGTCPISDASFFLYFISFSIKGNEKLFVRINLRCSSKWKWKSKQNNPCLGQGIQEWTK